MMVLIEDEMLLEHKERASVLAECMVMVQDMEEWDYHFIMSVAEKDWLSDRQLDIIENIYNKYIGIYT